MKHEKHEFLARLAPWAAHIEFRVRVSYPGLGEVGVGYWEPIVVKEITRDQEGIYKPPCFTLEHEEAQRLMDELWNCGLRPSEGSGSAGSLAATERHLADMKQIAFHALKMK